MSSEHEHEQAKFLETAKKAVKEQAFYMKRAMDGDKLDLALEHAMEMLREMKTNLLSPKSYYELYMKVQEELRELEDYLSIVQRSGRLISEIYEQVQSCVNIVPRLYLMCCVGGVYINSQEEPAKDILTDMVEMIKGVQHPMRGLFLRNYLTQVTKNRLPDAGSVFDGIGGNVQDAYRFVLQNFAEANRLWVRLQTQGAPKDRKKREKERLDLRILVGTNLVRLSQLEGLDAYEYETNVLPKILDEVIDCKDTIAQAYLMDCLIQVFPDEFHLATLEPFLKACTQLKDKVNIRTILESMIDRLTNHFSTSPSTDKMGGMLPDATAFKVFNDCVTTILETRLNITLIESLRLQILLVSFALKCFPTHVEYVSHCLAASSALVGKTDFKAQCAASRNQEMKSVVDTIAQIELLLLSPLSVMALKVLEIPSYTTLVSLLPWESWKGISSALLRSAIATNSFLAEPDGLESLLCSVAPLLKDPEGAPPSVDEDGRELAPTLIFTEEQQLVAKVVHLIRNPDTDAVLRMLVIARTHFSSGGSNRLQYTLTPLVFSALSLARRVMARENIVALARQNEEAEVTSPQFSTRKVFQYAMEVATMLAASAPQAEEAMKIFLHAAQAADECKYHAIAYEFTKEAFLLYEAEISDSKAQVRCLTAIIGALLNCRNFLPEDQEALVTKAAQYANKLLKKPDQSRIITLCSHLFYPTHNTVTIANTETEAIPVAHYNDPDRVLECMQRALKIASVSNPNIFVEILDRYIYFFEKNNPAIKVAYLSGLVALINEQLEGAAAEGQSSPATEAHYRNTLDYIKSRQKSAENNESFLQIQLSSQ